MQRWPENEDMIRAFEKCFHPHLLTIGRGFFYLKRKYTYRITLYEHYVEPPWIRFVREVIAVNTTE